MAKAKKKGGPAVVALPTIGILHSGSEDANRPQIAALMTAIADAGYIDGENVTIPDPLYSNDNATTLATNAASLVTGSGAVNVIVAAGGTAAAVAAKTANTNAGTQVPIVFTTVTDPVLSGLVANLNAPGGNLTGTAGLTSELDPTRLKLLQEFLPTLGGASAKVGVLTNDSRLKINDQFAALQAAANGIGLQLERQSATTPGTIDNAINNFTTAVKAILITADPMFNSQRKKVVRAVKTKGVPAIYQWREQVVSGGLMSYGPTLTSAYRQAGTYAAQILDGDLPKVMPVLRPETYELVINVSTAHKMGFDVPLAMLTRAVILQHKRKH